MEKVKFHPFFTPTSLDQNTKNVTDNQYSNSNFNFTILHIIAMTFLHRGVRSEDIPSFQHMKPPTLSCSMNIDIFHVRADKWQTMMVNIPLLTFN